MKIIGMEWLVSREFHTPIHAFILLWVHIQIKFQVINLLLKHNLLIIYLEIIIFV